MKHKIRRYKLPYPCSRQAKCLNKDCPNNYVPIDHRTKIFNFPDCIFYTQDKLPEVN